MCCLGLAGAKSEEGLLEGSGDGLPLEEEGGDGLPLEEEGGDGLPLEVGVAGVLTEGVGDGLAGEGVGCGEGTGEDETLDLSWFLVLDPATQSVSKFLERSVTTLALMWKVPNERPS